MFQWKDKITRTSVFLAEIDSTSNLLSKFLQKYWAGHYRKFSKECFHEASDICNDPVLHFSTEPGCNTSVFSSHDWYYGFSCTGTLSALIEVLIMSWKIKLGVSDDCVLRFPCTEMDLTNCVKFQWKSSKSLQDANIIYEMSEITNMKVSEGPDKWYFSLERPVH